MKKLLLFICLFSGVVSFAQNDNQDYLIKSSKDFFGIGAKTRYVKYLNSLNGEAKERQRIYQKRLEDDGIVEPFYMQTAGDNLVESGNLHYTGVVFRVIGSGIMAGGAIFFPPFIIIGGGVSLTGFIIDLVAWDKIRTAGFQMNTDRIKKLDKIKE